MDSWYVHVFVQYVYENKIDLHMGASRAGLASCEVNCAEYTSPKTYVAASHKIALKNRARCPLYGSVHATSMILI